MKLMVPVNSLESCKAQINSGANEIYLGYRIGVFRKMSFSARPQMSNDNIFSMPDKDEFYDIVRFAKENNVSVNLTANNNFSDYPIEGVDIENEYIKYILFALECGVEDVIISDIGLISCINQLGLPINIHASTLLDIDNSLQIEFLKENGVSRVVLAFQIAYEEIEQLCNNKKVEIEVFGHGGCSFGCCCMLDHGGEFGVPCMNVYFTEHTNEALNMINSVRSCSICSVWKLMKINVDALKLIGRGWDYKTILPITEMYKKAILIASESFDNDEYINNIKEYIPKWWQRMYCKQLQCKYEIIPSNRYSINIYGSN